MPTCDTSVTTPTGVFTYYDGDVTHCEAKVACIRKGQILAPVTNQQDLDALLSIADSSNASCVFHNAIISYHLGLDIRKCDGIETRVFSNNIIWNQTEHGPLYLERGHKTKDVNTAVIYPFENKMGIVKDYGGRGRRRYICLKPSSSSSLAEPLTQTDLAYNLSYGVLFTCGNLMIMVAGIMYMLKLKKSKLNEINFNVKEKGRN